MKKTDIEKLRIDIISGQDSALSMMISRDGMLARQGNGMLPADKTSIVGHDEDTTFIKLIEMLDENVFPHAGVYDHPNKPGIPLVYSIAFLDQHQKTSAFEFRFGSDTPEVGELLPFFDGFISQAVALTDQWYVTEKEKISAGSA